MERFFNYILRFGKIVSIIFVASFLFIGTITGLIGCTKMNTYKTEIPTFSEIFNKTENSNNTTSSVDKKQTPEYILIIDKMIKANDYTNEVKNIVLASFEDIPNEQKIEYAKGLSTYLTEFNMYAHTKGVKEEFLRVNKLVEYLQNYKSAYLANYETQISKNEKQTIERITAFSTFGLCILLFLISLIVPLLIKIEENTANN